MFQLVATLLAFFLLTPFAAFGRESCQGVCTPKTDHGLIFYADNVFYDQILKVWRFSGHVSVHHHDQYLYADQVTFHEETALTVATGDVRFKENGQDCLTADYIEITGSFKKALLRGIRFVTEDKSRFAGTRATLDNDGDLLIIENGVYTPCQPRANNPGAPPLWQIKSRYVEKRQGKGEISYIDAQFDLWGQPIFYVPYLRFYTKRSSGFLTPQYGTSSYLGLFAGFPYFIAFDHSDLKIIPYATTKRGGVGAFEYRQQGSNAYIQLQGSINASKPVTYYESDQAAYIPSPRGHFSLYFDHDINDDWRLKATGNLVSDKTYLRSVEELKLPGNIYSSPFLESKIEGERFSARDYLNIGGTSYQGLYDTDANNISFMVPSITYYADSESLPWGSLSFEGHSSAIQNVQRPNYERLILMGHWQYPFMTSLGQIITPFVSLRGDIYHAEPIATYPHGPQENTLRGFPQCGLQTSWPLLWSPGNLLAQPFLNLVIAPDLKEKDAIPQGDSQGFEYNDSVLLRKNRLPGYDRIDSGSRIVYGSHFMAKAPMIDDIHLFVGQTYMTSKPSSVMQQGGLQKGFSNIVGSLMATPFDWFAVDYRFSLNKDTLKAQFSEVTGHLGTDFLRLNVGYTRLESFTPTSYLGRQETIEASLSSHFHTNWGAKIEGNYDIARDQLLNVGCLLIYQNDCLKVSTKLQRTFYHSKDIQPATKFSISFALKNLGSHFTTIASDLRTQHAPAVSALKSSEKQPLDPLKAQNNS